VLDIDGVLDRRVFGFPCTTAAGIEALSLLHVHEFSIALNTARSASEVKDYCRAYSLAGGVAEHGSYLWDAVGRRERVLLSAETARQLEELRRHLRSIPGVFLDERHQYSIRAFTYRDKPLGMIQSVLSSARSSIIGDGALAPISTHIVNQLLVDLRLDRLAFHHTMIDTTIVAKEVDKGTGLVALRDWVLAPNAETIAVGDSEPDLAMFRVATRSFAPSNLSCRRQAHLLGCRIVHHPDQRGLLEIVRKIIHPDDRRCALCTPGEMKFPDQDKVFMVVMRAADRSWATNLLQAMLRNGSLN
jgi:hydroxymethylpyrimidine pyrophosphatase-like HAD family hydrolase